MNVLGCVAALVAMALAYLAAPNQRLLARPLGRKARTAAWMFAVLAFAAWIAGETSLPGIFAALTALMFGAVAFPYVTWLLRAPTDRKPR
jgi:membrane associated rhomboid family serine protease